MKTIVIDVDGTLCPVRQSGQDYRDLPAYPEMVARVRALHAEGWRIAIHTARNMNSFRNSVGEINAKTLPVLVAWLDRHGIPYDEIHVGKPWCGHEGFYVDDRAIRPSEFRSLSLDQLHALIAQERAEG